MTLRLKNKYWLSIYEIFSEFSLEKIQSESHKIEI